MDRGIFSAAILLARRIAPWVLLLALLLRGMIPGGFMPNPDPDNGKGWLVVCTGAGLSTVQVDGSDGGADAAPADTGQHGLCPFMALTLLAPALLLVALLLPPGAERRVLWPASIAALRRLLCGPVLGARAPPMVLGF